MEIKVLIGEDSQENVDTIKYLLENYPEEVRIKTIAKTLEKLKTALLHNQYDLAFLDIQFKKGTVFNVLDQLNNINATFPEIVFVTAHGSFEFATKAIQLACLDFINKPIKKERLYQVLDHYREKKKNDEEQKRQISLLLELIESDLNNPKIIGVVRSKNMVEYLKIDDLIYIEADGSTSIFHTIHNSFHSTRHLGYYIDLFQENQQITQISRFCVINKAHVKFYDYASRNIEMSEGTILNVSYRARKGLKRELEENKRSGITGTISRIKKLLWGEEL